MSKFPFLSILLRKINISLDLAFDNVKLKNSVKN